MIWGRRRYGRALSIRSAPARLKGLRDLPIASRGLMAVALGAALPSLTQEERYFLCVSVCESSSSC